MFLCGIWKNDNNSFSFTCVCKSGKHSLILRSTSELSCEHIEPPVQESLEVPNLLWSHKEVSLSRTLAILGAHQRQFRPRKQIFDYLTVPTVKHYGKGTFSHFELINNQMQLTIVFVDLIYFVARISISHRY